MKVVTLSELLTRGDKVSICQGYLHIEPASGKPVPINWLKENKLRLMSEISDLCGVKYFCYESFTIGRYGAGLYSGITLQFTAKYGENTGFACFNVELTKSRTTKGGAKGKSLKGKRFRVTERMEFYKLWLRTGLKLPPGYSSFHDYMGNLKQIIFTGEFSKGEKLDNKSIKPLELTYEQIVESFNKPTQTNIKQITGIQAPNNIPLSLPYKPSHKSQISKGLQVNQSACTSNHGNKVISKTDIRDNIIPLDRDVKGVRDQTTEEWLDDYSFSRNKPKN
jgi:hypothetical protein